MRIKTQAISDLQKDIVQIREEQIKPFTKLFTDVLTKGNIVNLLFGEDYYEEDSIMQANTLVEFILSECNLGKAEVVQWRHLLKIKEVSEKLQALIN